MCKYLNCAFTPKATWATAATGCHSFSMYAGDEERPVAWATRCESLKLTDELYANEQWRDRGDSQLGTDVIDGLLYRPMPAACKTRPFGRCSRCHTRDCSDMMWAIRATTGDFIAFGVNAELACANYRPYFGHLNQIKRKKIHSKIPLTLTGELEVQ